MESFIHLRKGKTPRRLHADLDGLKDDELGRGGFTGRTANIYRRNDPTAYRSVGPLRPVDVLSSELKPTDATDANGGPLLMFFNADCLVLLSRRSEPMPYFVRYVDGDLLFFVHDGSGLLETEFGPLHYRVGDWVYIPSGRTRRTCGGRVRVPPPVRGLVGDRRRHPSSTGPVRRGPRQRSGAVLMSACAKKREY
ncbi:MAG: homogentisate 1,2-dioxygenase [Mycobacterium sp.]|jgi:homogentisate 1,2-dioxygenase|nr:homogentisate 1,2-dioxygenase [Mycobacterium sp.]